jgi:hypothetical protein
MLSTQVPAYTPNTSSRTGTNANDDIKPCTERQSASCPVIWTSSCGETDSEGLTPRLLRQHSKTHRRILSSVATILPFQSPALFRATNIIKKETKLCVIVFHKVAV